MKTIALRFGDHFSPDCGTIAAHQAMIDKLGYVWYGKMGTPVGMQTVDELKEQENARILLIHSGKNKRYWAYISDITRETPPIDAIPEYYKNQTEKFKTWFQVTEFEPAPRDIMSKCIVASSGNALGEVSRHSMSPYFIISYDESESEK